ncbi:MAG TPA: helical backbone metal receptor [Casimicrobiaceae bacterium]|jgi:ABC-type Fe3+-hydroxamate transport system substrate-binding protein
MSPPIDTGSPNVDWLGVAHLPAGEAPRIASLVPSLTELLFALGVGPQVVARTGFCVHPKPDIVRVPKIGGTKDPDLARLRALAPTHLVVNVDENRRETVDAAREFIPNVIVTHPTDPVDNARLFALFGAIFNREREAAALDLAFDEALHELDATAARWPRETALYLIWRKPWMTVARDTYVSATLARAGLDTLPAESTRRYPELADDDPAWREADRIIVSSEPYAFRTRDAEELASRHGRPAHLIDGEWTSWYGSRAIEGLKALARFRRTLR